MAQQLSFIPGPSQSFEHGRDPLDRYYTPDAVARACVAVLPELTGRVLEPHCGGGAFARLVLAKPAASLHTGDIDPEAPGRELGSPAFLGSFLEHWETYDWVIGNPPYATAEEHCRHALRLAPRVAFLLRLAFLESQRRISFWAEFPPHTVWVLSARPSFTFDGQTDSAAYGWFYWERGSTDSRLRWL